MAATTRWLSPHETRPDDYPVDLPFLPGRACMVSRSGAGASELFSVMWPASAARPADLLRRLPGQRSALIAQIPLSGLTSRPALALDELTDRAISEWGSADFPKLYWLARAWSGEAIPEEVLTVFSLVLERSCGAGWTRAPGGGRSTVWLEKGPRFRIVAVMAAGVTLQEGLPELATAGD